MLGGREKLGLVDSLPVGVRQALRLDKPLRDEQAQHHRDRVLLGAGAREGGNCFRVVLALGLRTARVPGSHLPLRGRRRLVDAQPVRPGRRAAVVLEDDRAEELDRLRVELRLPARGRSSERSGWHLACGSACRCRPAGARGCAVAARARIAWRRDDRLRQGLLRPRVLRSSRPLGRTDRPSSPPRRAQRGPRLAPIRQRIESIFFTCKDLLARVGASLLALAACISLNHQLGRPSRAIVDYTA